MERAHIDDVLKKLDEEGNIGCDYSPSNPVCKEAAEIIRDLLIQNRTLSDRNEKLEWSREY